MVCASRLSHNFCWILIFCLIIDMFQSHLKIAHEFTYIGILYSIIHIMKLNPKKNEHLNKNNKNVETKFDVLVKSRCWIQFEYIWTFLVQSCLLFFEWFYFFKYLTYLRRRLRGSIFRFDHQTCQCISH